MIVCATHHLLENNSQPELWQDGSTHRNYQRMVNPYPSRHRHHSAAVLRLILNCTLHTCEFLSTTIVVIISLFDRQVLCLCWSRRRCEHWQSWWSSSLGEWPEFFGLKKPIKCLDILLPIISYLTTFLCCQFASSWKCCSRPFNTWFWHSFCCRV